MYGYCIPVEVAIIKYDDFHIQSGYEKMKELMEAENPPSCVFITNYYMHVSATKYLTENREHLKKYLASILDFSRVLVAQPMMEIGSRAVLDLLYALPLTARAKG